MANTKRVQFRRGTDAEHSNFTGASGELTVNTTNNSVHVHDGVTLRGHELLKRDFSNSIGGTINGAVTVSNNLIVSSYVQFGSSLTVDSFVGLSSDVTIGKNLGIGHSLTVTGFVGLSSDLNVSNTVGIGSNLTVGGGTTIAYDLDVGYNVDIGGNADIAGNVNIGGTTGIDGSISIGSTVGIGSNTTIGGSVAIGYTVSIGSNTEIGGTLDVDQFTQLNDGLNVVRSVGVGQSLTVDGLVGFASDLIVNKGIVGKTGILSALNVAGISTLESAIISGLNYPILDGQPGQALVTDGAGNIAFGAGGSASESRIRVSANEGNDSNDGRILPVATIKRGLQLASERLKNTVASRFIDGANLLKLNKEFIKAEVVAYVENQYPSITSNPDYNANTCKRDVGYILDAIIHDLSYGGNSKTVNAALAYWEGAVNAVAGEVTETVAAFQYIITLSRYIINNQAAPTTYQGVVTQVYDLNVPYDASINRTDYDLFSCANVWSAIGSYVGIITSVISGGVGFAPAKTYPQPETLDAVTVFVEGGDYIESNPLIVPDGISIVGDSLRNTIIRPLTGGKDLFRLRNGCYLANISMKDYVVNGVPQHTFDYAVAFDDPFDTSVSRVGYAGSLVNVTEAYYNNTTGITTITTANPHGLIKGQVVRLSGLGFTCSYDSGITTFFYPEANASGQVDFDVVSVGSPVEFTIKAGITTVQHFYAGGGTAQLGKAKITLSPYVQNCSILSFLGANGVFVDGSKIQDNNIPAISEEAEKPPVGAIPTQGKSMVANAFTMVSFGGIGWRTINDGYAQVVSCFQIFCRYGSLTQSGGYLSITNSATNFGLYALRSTGFSPNSFTFDRGRIAATGVSGGLQTLKVVGLGRSDQDLYVLRFFDNNDNDVTSSFKPLVISEQFNVSDSVNTATNTFTIPAHPFINGESVVYQGNEQASPPQVINGLVSGNQYYVLYIDSNSFKLYEDDSLTRLVSLGSTFVGINTFIKNNQDFFAVEIIHAHNDYQAVSLAATTSTLNFVSGRQVTQSITGGQAVGVALTYIPATRTLIVSNEEVSGVTNLFSASGSIIQDHSGSPISIGVTAVAGITTYHTVITKVDSTIPGNVIPDIGDLPETYKLHFHRPSIINSSSHTWEFSGSGTDYNALPQNGGKTKPETEQVFEQGGRVYSSGTNELGDFKIGNFIVAFNRTGNIIFNNKVTIGQLDSLRLSLSGGTVIEEFSTDTNLGETEIGGPLNRRVSTQLAVRTFLNNRLGDFIDQNVSTSAIPNAIVKLTASGQINADLIPPKVVNFITVNTIGGKTSLVNYIPAANIKQGDTVAEPENSYVLVQDTVQEFLILDSTTRNYRFFNGDIVESTLSAGAAVGIVTAPTSVAYGTTGLVKGVPLTLTGLSGGSGYTNPGIYTGVTLNRSTGIGTDLTATITVSAAGTVSNVAINTGGRYYAAGDVLTLNNPALIGGRTGGSNFQVTISTVQTRLYVKLTNSQKFPGTTVLPDFIVDRDAVAISTSMTVGVGRTFDPTDLNTSGSVDFFNNRIILPTIPFSNGDPVVYNDGGGNGIGGLLDGNTYYVKRVGITSVELHNTYALSSAIPLTSSGTGTHELIRYPINENKDTFVFVNHGFAIGDAIRVTGSTPTGITTGSFYYVGSATTNSFTFHTTQSDATQSANGITLNAVGITSLGIGTTISITEQNVRYSQTVNTSSALEENWSLLAKSDIDAANIISGTVSPSRLGSGSATQDTFLGGNSQYQKVIKSVGIGTTQPIQITATSFDSAPGGVGVNTYYGNINISLNRVAQTTDTFSTLGISKFKTSTFSIGADGAVSIKNSTTGDVDAATLGGQAPSYYIDPNNLSAAVPVTKGGTGLTGLPANGAILQGNGTAFNQTVNPTFTGNVVFNNGIAISGVVTATRFVSNVAQGTAPVSVASSTVVTNLNADFIDGLNANNITSQIDRARTFAYFMGIS
jgi:acyl-[acyl carrier protein]--UDP-N-acetylglucosamine O-acyltransferase